MSLREKRPQEKGRELGRPEEKPGGLFGIVLDTFQGWRGGGYRGGFAELALCAHPSPPALLQPARCGNCIGVKPSPC